MQVDKVNSFFFFLFIHNFVSLGRLKMNRLLYNSCTDCVLLPTGSAVDVFSNVVSLLNTLLIFL